MKKKLLLMLMVGSIILPSVVFWGSPKHEVVAEKKEQTVNLNVVPHVNGHKLKDFSKIDVDALKVGVSYFDSTYNEIKLFSEQNDKNLVIRKIPKNTQGVMLYANNQEEINEYGVRVKSADFNYYNGKTVPIFESIDNEDPHYLNTKEDSYLAINYELKYDLKLNFENEEFAKNVEIELLDHDNRHVDIQKEIKGNSVIIKNIEYNPVKSSLKLKLDNKVFKLKSNENAFANEQESNVFMLTPSFKNKKVNAEKHLEVSVDLEEFKKEVSKPLNIPDKALRQEIYKQNFEIYKHIPADVDENKAKANFDIYESQVEYIKKLMIAENVDATGVEKLINVNILEVKGKKHNNFNFSTFKKLEYLDINKVGIETLDVSALEHLKSIKANDNNLKEIKFNLTNKIEWLDLKGNNFTNGLDFTKLTSLKHLDLSDQKEKLKNIDITPLVNLTELKLERHNLKKLDLSKNTGLLSLSLDNNKEDDMGLTEIDLSNNKKLTAIYLKENKLSELKLKNLLLSGLNIHGNRLTTIDLSTVEFKKDYSYFDSIQRVKYKTNNLTKIDMSKIVGKENLDKVKVDEKDTNLSYDKNTGILNISSNNPKGFKYIYNTGNSGTFSAMVVNVELELDETKPEVNKEALQKAVEKAKDPETTKGKTEESIEVMNKVLKKAEEILAKADATREEVNKAEEELTASINNLKDKPNLPKVEKVELKNEDGSIVVTGDTNTLNKDWKVLTKGVNPSELVGKEYDAYDINLKDANNGETQPRGEVTVTIKVKLKVEKLYHIDGGLKEIPFTYENGKITFKTSHFSVYAVVYGDKQEDNKKPDNDNSKPGSNNNKSGKDAGKSKNSIKKNKLPRTNISGGLSYMITSILALGVAGAVGYKKKY
ncbi:leucine-rich repeat domain-containing protein [Parvimonas micra]